MKSFWLLVAFGLLLATDLSAQVHSAGVSPSNIRIGTPVYLGSGNATGAYRPTAGVSGLPTGPNPLTYPLNSTPANNAIIRNNAWAAYNANLRTIPTATNPNRLAAPQKLVDPNAFVQRPTSAHRYNFQFSDNEVRSVQAALRRLGIYPGQVDGILGPDTQRAIKEYQVRTRQPVTGQPDRGLNASLGIF
jgi:hypothetical protein